MIFALEKEKIMLESSFESFIRLHFSVFGTIQRKDGTICIQTIGK